MTRAFVVDLVRPELRGTALVGYTFAIGLAALPASLVAGLLWDAVSPAAPFVLSAVLMLTASVTLALSRAVRSAAQCAVQESRS
jgi:MFS family permease